MSDGPVWVQTLSALLTPTIAGAVAVIGFLQWRTAHRKVVLDLFEKRLAVYDSARASVSMVVTSGSVTPDSDQLMLQASKEAMFLFGEDVRWYLEGLWKTMSDFRYYDQEVSRGTATENAILRRSMLLTKLSNFYSEGAEVFAPYIRMDQKLVKTTAQWLKEANKRRLSYADEKQR